MPHSGLKIDGKVVNWPSVTTVLNVLSKDWKEFWHRKVGFAEADRVSEASRKLGTACHDLVEKYLRDGFVSTQDSPPQVKRLFELWLEWWQASGLIVVSQEQKVVSHKKKYHGTYDCLLTDGDTLMIADWKFSGNDDALRPVQLGGYSYAYNEGEDRKITSGIIVRIDPKKFRVFVKEFPVMKPYEKAFLILRKAYDVQKGRICAASSRTKKTA